MEEIGLIPVLLLVMLILLLGLKTFCIQMTLQGQMRI